MRYPIFFALLIVISVSCERPTRLLHGDIAKDFVGATANGDSLRLSDYKGSYVLLDFWGSWCGPCRAANRELVDIYAQFKDAKFKNANGFVILSVGIETDRDAWLAAIAQDGLVWKTHISDLQRLNSPIAQSYDVHSIPTQFLIDPQGIIVGVNLSAEQTKKLLIRQIE